MKTFWFFLIAAVLCYDRICADTNDPGSVQDNRTPVKVHEMKIKKSRTRRPSKTTESPVYEEQAEAVIGPRVEDEKLGFKGAGDDYKEEEEEDVDMGGMFGDDDDDYGCAYQSSSAPALRSEEI